MALNRSRRQKNERKTESEKYKRLYEQISNKTIKPLTIKNEYPVVHLRCRQMVPYEYMDRINDITNRMYYENFEKEIIQFIEAVKTEKVFDGVMITGELLVVDRRNNSER